MPNIVLPCVAVAACSLLLSGCELKKGCGETRIAGFSEVLAILEDAGKDEVPGHLKVKAESREARKAPELAVAQNMASAQPAAAKALIYPAQRLALKTVAARADPAIFTFPNNSFGRFAAEVTTGLVTTQGLATQQSATLLEFRQPLAAGGARRVYIAAVYNAAIGGFTASVAGRDGASYGTPIDFSGVTKLDLRIEQTASQLIFSARSTPADQSSGGWMPVYSVNAAPDPAAFHVYVGAQNLQKGAHLYFENFALDGEAIGGTSEYPIISLLRNSVESIRAAQAKIAAAAPDLAGATIDLETAANANADAVAAIENNIYYFQNGVYGNVALRSLLALAQNLSAARIAVTTGEEAKAAPQVALLNSVVKGQLVAMVNLLGLNTTKPSAMPNFFFLRVP